MVRHTALGKIVGPDIFGTISGSHLAFSQRSQLVMLFCLLQLIEAGAQNLQRFILIFQLRFLVLTGNNDSCRNMGKTYRRVCGIYTLSSISGSPENVKLTIIQIQLEINLLCLRHNGYSNGRSVDTSAAFSFRHTLYPVNAAFVF